MAQPSVPWGLGEGVRGGEVRGGGGCVEGTLVPPAAPGRGEAERACCGAAGECAGGVAGAGDGGVGEAELAGAAGDDATEARDDVSMGLLPAPEL